MRVVLVTPSADAETPGNRVTAERWATMLRGLGHVVAVDAAYPAAEGDGPPDALPDLLVALHARKSLESVRRFHERRAASGRGSASRIVLALTGTDLYRDLAEPGADSWEAVERADRLVVLQERAPEALPASERARTRVIYQSVPELWDADDPPGSVPSVAADRSDGSSLRVCMLAHLRPVKDPLLAAEAAELLPPDVGVGIDHYGSAYDDALASRARAATEGGSGYRWHGELPRAEALRRLAASDLLLLTSRLEGAGNAASEAITARVPILCTRVAGLVGMVGEDYPGLFTPGDAGELAGLLERAAEEPAFLGRLRDGVEARRPLLDPACERAAWRELLGELHGELEGG